LAVTADSHTHTDFSGDGKSSMSSMCQAAIDRGLSYICFTDHLDCNPADESFQHFDYDRYTEAISRVREEFEGKIRILKGIEFSEPHVFRKEYEEILRREFDVIMVGIHYIRIDLAFHWISADRSIGAFGRQKIYRRYYEELLQVARLGGFDVLAHFDNPKRYLKEPSQETDLIAEILQELVDQGVVLEVNTSPLRRGYHECSPDSDILQRYTKAGGTRITIGSDAHSDREVAADFDHAYRLSRDHRLELGIFQGRRFVAI
jgi:histidinol-phosphatase (PHP family)